MALDDLPKELLLIIMDYLDMYSLMALKCVCNRFYSLIDSYQVLTKKSNNLLVTNQMSEKFRKRCRPLLSSYSSKYITHYNWINGIYKKRRINSQSYIRGLQLTQNNLLSCFDKYLYAYNRTKDGTVNEIKNIEITTCKESFFSFVCLNDVLISGHSQGSIRLWRRMESKNNNYFKLLKVHSNVYDYVINIDATSDYIAASLTNKIKIYKYTYEEDVLGEGNKIFGYCNSHIRSIKFDPTGTKIAWISAASDNIHKSEFFSIYDINNEKQNLFFELKEAYPGKVLWEDPHTILMLVSRHIKKLDIRTSKFVRTWDAPDDVDRFSCFSSDNLYTVITGTENKVILWDQRKNVSVKEYAVNDINTQTMRNEIYSLSFDSSHLYIAFYNGLNYGLEYLSNTIYEFDFKGNYFDPAKNKCRSLNEF